jgi:SAM-dependent methyltransferase
MMMHVFGEAAFDRAFSDLVSGFRWQEEPEYYPRYRSRYAAILRRFAEKAPQRRAEVLDIGGGQLAFLAVALWGDQGCVADVDETCFAGLRSRGIDAFQWNLALEDAPTDRRFDAIFFSEVIEHLPVPGHIALRRLRMLLRPNGLLVCSTPNLYRLRNVVYLLRGRPLFDHFDLPGVRGYGHVLEYSADHLAWQFERAGFDDCTVELRDFTHTPHERLDRALSTLGAPLRRIPRYRDNLLALATAP